jgi:hypothetical protein
MKEPKDGICKVSGGGHHYHSGADDFYCGTAYMGVCCYCGRVQMIVYRSSRETPDLVCSKYGGGSECGPFVK